MRYRDERRNEFTGFVARRINAYIYTYIDQKWHCCSNMMRMKLDRVT